MASTPPPPQAPFVIRPVGKDETRMWIALRQALWPYEPPDALAQEAAAMDDDQRAWVRLVFDERGEAVGLLEFSVRDQSPGSGGRALPYVEGWYVTPAVRRQGVGRMLIAHLETWAVVHGYRQIASDTIPALFPDSTAAHLALGFAIVDEGPDEDGDQARFFHKPLL